MQIRVDAVTWFVRKRIGLVQCPPLANLSDFQWIEPGGAERS